MPRCVGEKDGDNDSGGCDPAEVGAVSLYSPYHASQGPLQNKALQQRINTEDSAFNTNSESRENM